MLIIKKRVTGSLTLSSYLDLHLHYPRSQACIPPINRHTLLNPLTFSVCCPVSVKIKRWRIEGLLGVRSGDGVSLPVCEMRYLYGHTNSPSACVEKDGIRGECGEQRTGVRGWDRTGEGERGAVLKGYPLSATLAKGITPCCRLFSISCENAGSPLLL